MNIPILLFEYTPSFTCMTHLYYYPSFSREQKKKKQFDRIIEGIIILLLDDTKILEKNKNVCKRKIKESSSHMRKNIKRYKSFYLGIWYVRYIKKECCRVCRNIMSFFIVFELFIWEGWDI